MNIIQRLNRVFKTDITAVTFIIGWVAIFLSFGFYVSVVETSNYSLLNNILPKTAWGILFNVYGAGLIYSSLYRVSKVSFSLLSISGIWLWSYLFFSFAIFDPTPIASTEWMLLIPIICQFWIFVSVIIYEKRKLDETIVDLRVVLLISNIKREIGALNTELISLNKENQNLKNEVNCLTTEINKIRSSMCFIHSCGERGI